MSALAREIELSVSRVSRIIAGVRVEGATRKARPHPLSDPTPFTPS